METSSFNFMNGMCRCCASEGVFKDFRKPYTWMGEEEVYADMLKECFDLNLHTSEVGQEGGICEVCITQLRNASNFKKQVLNTEEQFKKHIQNKLFKPSIVKVEVADEAEDSDENNMSADDSYSGTEYEIPVKAELDEPKTKKRAAAVKATTKTSRAKKSKADVGESSTKSQHTELVKIEMSEKRPSSESDLEGPDTDLVKVRSNFKEILINSNAMSSKITQLSESGQEDTATVIKNKARRKELVKGRFDVIFKNVVINSNVMQTSKITQSESHQEVTATCIKNKASRKESVKDRSNINEILINTNATPSEITQSSESDEEDIDTGVKNNKAPRTELVKHRSNIKEILINSNATPIRRYGGIGYTCCYCEEQYAEPSLLKKHSLESHKNVSEANFMKNMNMSEYVIKLDITGLSCNLCDVEIDTLDNLLEHLKKKHEKNIFTDVKNHIFPFKFKDNVLKCTMCLSSFNKFRMLVGHMHVHYRNFICTICDAGFVNRNALTQHLENHKIGEFTCNYCPKIYKTEVKKRFHERNAHTHSDSMNKCGYCKETFKDYWKKEVHLATVHGVKSLVPKCQACDKTFSSRRLLTTHVKRDHLMERPHKCSECEMAFFSSTHLKNHMVKHTGSRAFRCAICLKSYGRKKTLNSHMRIHETHRFKCEHCSKDFVQKCSWRSHMRSKHGKIV